MQKKMCVSAFKNGTFKWKIFNLPSAEPVQYCFIVRQKRELWQFFDRCENQVSIQNGYCSIVDEDMLSFRTYRQTVLVLFCDAFGCVSSLGLRICVMKRNLIKRCNSLLIFLKLSRMNHFYQLHNGNIYIQCEKNINWKLFYSMYDFLLKQSFSTIIGREFYYSLTSQILIKNELHLFYLLKKSVKGSEHNPGKSRKMNKIDTHHFKYQNVLKCRGNQESATYIFKHPLISTESLTIYRPKVEEYHKPMHSTGLKRKSQEMESEVAEVVFKSSIDKFKFFKSSSSAPNKAVQDCKGCKWYISGNCNNYSAINYADILEVNGIQSLTILNVGKINPNISVDTIQTPVFSKRKNESLSTPLSQQKMFSELQLDKKLSFLKSVHMSELLLRNKENVSHLVKEISFRSMQPGVQNTADDVYSIITDKTVCSFGLSSEHNVNKTNQKCLSDDMLGMDGNNFNVDYFNITEKKQSYESSSLKKRGATYVCSEKHAYKENMTVTSFQTASGKKINISKTALERAEKIFNEIQCEGNELSFETAHNSKPFSHAKEKKHIKILQNEKGGVTLKSNTCERVSSCAGETSKRTYIDTSLDGDLADKIFEQISFEENITVPKHAVLHQPSLGTSKINVKTAVLGKRKKSLGGRQSLKFDSRSHQPL